MHRFLFGLAFLSAVVAPSFAAGQDPSVLWPTPGRAETWIDVLNDPNEGRYWVEKYSVVAERDLRLARMRYQAPGVPEILETWTRYDCARRLFQVVTLDESGSSNSPAATGEWKPIEAGSGGDRALAIVCASGR